jgi:SAM-dependent methyltransferase
MGEWFEEFAEGLWLKPDEEGAEEAAFITGALRLQTGDSVLDAPCGAGRIAVHVARHGCAVTGVDLQESFLQRARAMLRNEGLDGRFLQMDLREMAFRDEFDGAHDWFGSFGYFSDEENRHVLERFATALRPGGRLLIDQVNREYVLRNFRATMERPGLRITNRWNARTQRIEGEWITTADGEEEHSHSSMRLYTPAQLKRAFEHAGPEVEATYGDFDGSPYRRASRRLIVVGRKPEW